MMKPVFIAALMFFAAACATKRPDDIAHCPNFYGFETRLEGGGNGHGGHPLKSSLAFSASPDFEPAGDELFDAFLAAAEAAPPNEEGTLDILVLSGGGKWGAYGAGFLNGWSEATGGAGDGDAPFRSRLDIDMTTGISTGAMQLAAVYAGFADNMLAQTDAMLKRSYTIDTEVLVDERAMLSILRGRRSLYETHELERRLDLLLAEYGPFYESIDPRHRAYVGAVNIDDTKFYVVDLKAIAASDLPDDEKRRCFAEAFLASSAVPAVYPARFVNGDAFVDGGVRYVAFASALLLNPKVVDYLKRRNIKPYLSVIFNGSLDAVPPCDADSPAKDCQRRENLSIVDIAFLSMNVAVDQIGKDSIYRLENDLREKYGPDGYIARYTYIPNADILAGAKTDPRCAAFLAKAERKPFDNDFMNCIYEIGYERGRDQQTAWLSFGEMPSSAPGE